MLTNSTVSKLYELRMSAMAAAFTQQLEDPQFNELSFEDRFSLLVEIALARSDGTYRDVMKKYRKSRVLILDEWLLYPLKETEAKDLLEIIELRNQTASTIFCSQIDIPGWHEYLYDPTLADAICDRIKHNSYVITLKGESMRKLTATVD